MGATSTVAPIKYKLQLMQSIRVAGQPYLQMDTLPPHYAHASGIALLFAMAIGILVFGQATDLGAEGQGMSRRQGARELGIGYTTLKRLLDSQAHGELE